MDSIASFTLALALALLGPAQRNPEGNASPTTVDLDLARDGLRARLGATADRWQIEFNPKSEGLVELRLRRDDEAIELHRTLELRGDSTEERSRELAATLALLIDEAELELATPDDTRSPATEGSSEPALTATEPSPGIVRDRRAWVSAGPRVGAGRPGDRDAGVGVFGGIELLGGLLHPIFELAWTTQARELLRAHYMHLGAGVAAGSSLLERRLWLGGGILPRLVGVALREGPRRTSTFAGGVDLFALGHYRVPLTASLDLQLSLRLGIDLSFPPLIFRGATARLYRGEFRLLSGALIGLRW